MTVIEFNTDISQDFFREVSVLKKAKADTSRKSADTIATLNLKYEDPCFSKCPQIPLCA